MMVSWFTVTGTARSGSAGVSAVVNRTGQSNMQWSASGITICHAPHEQSGLFL